MKRIIYIHDIEILKTYLLDYKITCLDDLDLFYIKRTKVKVLTPM